jgi:lipoate-protein ligase A
MAVDEMLLEWAAEHGGCAWRFYRWSEPTLSLGYFQDYGDWEKWGQAPRGNLSAPCSDPAARSQSPFFQGYALVRRLTGGGAILHDAELTYSLVVHAGHPLAARRESLYDAVHQSLIGTLAGFGVGAALCEPAGRPAAEPFLCFERRAPGDVLAGRIKIAGSAQRRRRGAVLQHGSVLLRRSPAAPELPGLEDVSGVAIPVARLSEAWLAELVGRLGISWRPDPLTEAERCRAAALAEGRYAAVAWTKHRDAHPSQGAVA